MVTEIEVFSQKFQAAQRHLEALFLQASGQSQPSMLLSEALEELSGTLEELHMVSAELYEQHEQLQEAKQTVEVERQQYLELFELAPEGYLVTDCSGVIRQVNRTAAILLNRRQDLLPGKPLAALVARSGHQAFYTLLNQLQQGEPIQGQELGLQPRDRSPVYVELTVSVARNRQGQIDGFRWLLHDLSRRRQTEAALRHSEGQLRLLTDALPVLIADVDAQLRYRFNNRAYEHWFGLPRSAITGHYIWEIWGDALYRQIRPHIEAALSGQQVTYEMELSLKDGHSRWVSVSYIPHTGNAEGKGFFALVSNISDRKAVERLKDEFISVVSHELRTPLATIHGALKILTKGLVKAHSGRGQELLQVATQNSHRLVRLVNDILDLDRLQSGKIRIEKQPVQTTDLTHRAVASLQLVADQAGVHLVVSDPGITLQIDGDRLTQVLTNLLDNAIKFSPQGSTIRLRVELAPEAQQLKAADHQPIPTVLFRVEDQGRGIPPENLETIFERFQQVDASDSRQKGGTGLGLAICRSIVEEHRGKIRVESILGQGSRFHFTVPTSDP